MRIIHVTEVLSLYADFAAIRPEVLENAADRGTRVHDIIAEILQDQWIPKIPEDCRGYIASFKHFQKSMLHKTEYVEKEALSTVDGLVGHLDFVGYLKDKPDARTILDWKTPVGLSHLWEAQLNAYARLAQSEGFPAERIGVLQLHPKGNPPKLTWYEKSPRILEAYLCALTAYRYFIRKGDK